MLMVITILNNMFNKGLIKDVSLNDMPEGSWRNAKNIVQDVDGNIINEAGNQYRYVVDTGYIIIGIIECNDKVVLFSTNNTNSEIGIYTGGTSYTRVLRDSVTAKLNFNQSYPITGEYYYNNLGELIIAFTDNYNKPRILNLDNLPFTVDGSNIFNDSVSKLELIEFFPEIQVPYITNITNTKDEYASYLSKEGSSLIEDDEYKGIIHSCYFFIRYNIQDVRYTNWYCVSDDLISVLNIKDNPTTITISNVSNIYDKLQVAIIYYENGILQCRDLGEYDIQSGTSTLDITYSGVDETVNLDINSIIIPTTIFNKVEIFTSLNNRLVAGNIQTNTNVSLQKYVNNCKIVHNTSIPSGEELEPTFCPDEVYAFYMVFTFKDGTVSPAYHIPGRAARTYETEDTTIGGHYTYTLAERYLYNEYGTKRFHIKSTADTPAADSVLSYWHNEGDYYPEGEDSEVWEEDPSNPGTGRQKISGETTLENTNVRHHKMPSFMQMAGNPIKLKVTDLFIPDAIRDNIANISICYASRDGNQQVLDVCPIVGNKFIYENWLGVATTSKYWCHPINLMVEQPDITIEYVKEACRWTGISLGSFTDYTNQQWLQGEYNLAQISLTKATAIFDVNTIGAITTNKYLQRNNSVVNNRFSDAKLELEAFGGVTVGDGGEGKHIGTGEFKNYSLHTLNKNPYSKLENQKLVQCVSIRNTGSSQTTISFAGGDIIEVIETENYVKANPMIINTADGAIAFAAELYIRELTSYRLRSNKIINIDNNSLTNSIQSEYNYLPGIIQEVEYETSGSNATGSFKMNPEFGFSYLKVSGNDKSQIQAYIETINAYHKEYADMFPSLLTDNGFIPYKFNSVIENEFPYTIRRSLATSKESDDINWTTFLANEYYILSEKNKGVITNLQALNKALIIQTTNTTYLAKLKDVLQTNNVEAYLGQADIFDRDPDELIPMKEGYAGNQHKLGTVVCKHGFVFIDAIDGKVFLINDQIIELSNKGLSKIFKDILDGLIADNIYYGDGITMTFDDKWNRLIIAIRNYSVNNAIYTLSYSFNSNTWIAFHSYLPRALFRMNNEFYSIARISNRDVIYEHNIELLRSIFYHSTIIADIPNNILNYESFIEPVFVYGKSKANLIKSVLWQTIYEDPYGNREEFYKTITGIALYTSKHFTGEISLSEINRTGNIINGNPHKLNSLGIHRTVDGVWFFNKIRDALSHNIILNDVLQKETKFIDDYGVFNTTQIDLVPNKEYFNKSLLIDIFVAVRLIMDNGDNGKITILNVNVNQLNK
jgi:hypothetical protein